MRSSSKLGTMRRHRRPMSWKATTVAVCLLFGSIGLSAQTFEIAPKAPPKKSQGKKEPKGKAAAPAPGAKGGIGWGSGIETARSARAAQDAIKKGDYNSAVMFATRAANSAPKDPNLWFG